MTLRECAVAACPYLTRRTLCVEHQDEADARALVDWASCRYGVDLDDMVTDHTCPRCGLPVGNRPHEQGTTTTSCQFSRAGG